MLNTEQIASFQKLISTITNSKYKDFVKYVVEGWKESNYAPKQGYYGTRRSQNVFCDDGGGCCVIGAFRIGAQESIRNLFTLDEQALIICTFDNDYPDKIKDWGEKNNPELFHLISKVREIAINV